MDLFVKNCGLYRNARRHANTSIMPLGAGEVAEYPRDRGVGWAVAKITVAFFLVLTAGLGGMIWLEALTR